MSTKFSFQLWSSTKFLFQLWSSTHLLFQLWLPAKFNVWILVGGLWCFDCLVGGLRCFDCLVGAGYDASILVSRLRFRSASSVRLAGFNVLIPVDASILVGRPLHFDSGWCFDSGRTAPIMLQDISIWLVVAFLRCFDFAGSSCVSIRLVVGFGCFEKFSSACSRRFGLAGCCFAMFWLGAWMAQDV